MDRQPIVSEISRQKKLQTLLDHLDPSCAVLEVGSGESWFSEQLRSRGFRVTSLDLTPPADIVGDINDWRNLGIEQGSYDVCIALEVVEHVDCIDSLRAICRPGGLIFLSSPHPQWDWVMKILEFLRLTQKRTSPHSNLTDFDQIPLQPLIKKRPAFIHQVALFRNAVES